LQGSSQFVSNVFFARFVLGERITLRVVTATCIIIGGQVRHTQTHNGQRHK
jgi:hypothetical protein